MTNAAPMMDSGTAMTGMITLRSEPRNRKITTMTIRMASTRVFTTSVIDSSMYSVAS